MTDMKAIARARPVDSTAARVVSAGEHYEFTPQGGHTQFTTEPLPMRKLRPRERASDLTGRVCGRLTVIGYLGPSPKGARWQCRCVCGRYTARLTKAIKNPANHVDGCIRCRRVDHLRNQSQFIHTGRNER